MLLQDKHRIEMDEDSTSVKCPNCGHVFQVEYILLGKTYLRIMPIHHEPWRGIVSFIKNGFRRKYCKGSSHRP